MIAFGCSVASEDRWRRWAQPGIERVAEPDSLVIVERGKGSLQVRCNRALRHAAAHDDLEALVLLHEDTEIRDPEFMTKVREALADPSVAIVGPIGGRGARSIAWWLGSEPVGRVDIPNIGPQSLVTLGDGPASGEVDVVDGLMMVLSPWAVRELRFDEELSNFHGYDVDICFQAIASGRRVLVAKLDVIHHSFGGIGDREPWIRANVAFRRKWHVPPVRARG
jgi:hypothetical protein